MNKEDKELLLRDLSARLPYKVIVDYSYNAFYVRNGNHVKHGSKRILTCDLLNVFMSPRQNEKGEYIKPYLRPMSSMTKEERDELEHLSAEYFGKALDKQIQESLSSSNRNESEILEYIASSAIVDWLIAHHFDFRNFIEKGLALEAPEGMYKTK